MKKGIIFVLGLALGILIMSVTDRWNMFQGGRNFFKTQEKSIFEIEDFKTEYIGINFEERPMLSDVRIRYYFEDEMIHFIVDFISDLACNVSFFNPPNGDIFLLVNENVEKKAMFSIDLKQFKEVEMCTFMFIYNQFNEEYGPDSVRYVAYLDEDIVMKIFSNV